MSLLTMFDVASEGMSLILVFILLCHTLSEVKYDHEGQKSFNALAIGVQVMLVSDIACRLCDGLQGYSGGLVHRIFAFLLYASYLATALLYVNYLYSYIGIGKNVARRELSIQLIVAIANAILLVITQFTGYFYYFDQNGNYCRSSGIIVFGISMLVMEATGLVMIISGRKYLEPVEFKSAFVFVVLPLIATGMQVVWYGVSISNLAVVAALFVVFFNIQDRRSRTFIKQQKVMADQQISLMISQIQPHFLYNAISSIRELCLIDANEARDALGDFAMYLRANMDSIKASKPVPFEKELNHVEHYLNIEKLRFGDLLEVEYDIQVIDFELPALSLQPLVENAVKHGTCARDDGGTVYISTYEEGSKVYVEVRDDGPGFDCDSFEDIPVNKNDGRSHIGLSNVHDRIIDMSDGMLYFKSKENIGTTVTIVIPR